MAGGILKRWLAKWMLRDKSDADILKLISRHKPADVLAHQEKVAWADGLAIIAPVFWMGFPAILKGWIDRVLSYGFAYTLTEEGWKGDVNGRVPLLKHRKALIMMTTFFTEDHYSTGFESAMQLTIDDWTFRYPGVQQVEHEYFYAVRAGNDDERAAYLDRALALGKNY
jgi:NAD(P)H dehydrogenase (quinone)